MSIKDKLNFYLPEGWRVTNVSELDEDEWQVICTDDDHVVTATGDGIEEALAVADVKIEHNDFAGRAYRPPPPDPNPIPLLSRLGLVVQEKPKEPFKRRI
jgi:hypothetical protein